MKYILEGKAQEYPEIIGLLPENKLNDADNILQQYHLKVEKIEVIEGQKVVYIVEIKD